MSLELEEVTGTTGDVFEDFLIVFRQCLSKVKITFHGLYNIKA